MTNSQKLDKIEKLVSKWMQEENHPKCVDELNEILHPKYISEPESTNMDEFLQDLRMEQMDQM